MANRLLISDIHLNDYRRFNYEPKSRLLQFSRLAERIVEIGKEHNCDELDIAGDFIDKPTNRPYILHEAREFIRILSNGFVRINYILGQHDQDSKATTHNYSDSVVHIVLQELDNDKFHYMDKTLYNWNGRKIAYMDWYPTQDLSWFDGKVDLLVGHVTVDSRFGQEIDQTKFEIGIFGDIHQHKKVDNMYCIGVPIQGNLGDQREGTCMVYNSDDNTCKWVNIDPDHTRFLQMEYTTNPNEEGFSDDKLTYYVYRPNRIVDTTKKIDISAIDLDSILDKYITEYDLTNTHNDVLSRIKEVSEIDFDFSLVSIYIKNFRSIAEFKYDFANNLCVFGNNGSGKSSFILAIHKGLIGDRSLHHHIRKGEREMAIVLTIKYQGQIFEITRGTKWGLKINGTPQNYNNKSQFDADVYVKLPFLYYADSYFFNYWNTEILNSINNARRVELITKYNRLDILDSYNLSAIELIQENQETLNSIKNSIRETTAKIEETQRQIDSLYSRIKEKESELTEPRDVVTNRISTYDECKSNRDERTSLISMIKSLELNIAEFSRLDINSYQHRSEFASNMIEHYRCLLSRYSEIQSKQNNIKLRYETAQRELAEAEAKYKETTLPSYQYCRECGAKLNVDKVAEHQNKAKEAYDLALKNKTDIYNEAVEVSKLGDLKVLIPLANKKLAQATRIYQYNYEILVQHKAKLSSVANIQSQIDSSNARLSELLERKLPNEDEVLSTDIEPLREMIVAYRVYDELNIQVESTGGQKKQYESQLEELNNEFTCIDTIIRNLITYRDLTSKKGQIYKDILSKIADRLTNEQFKFNVVSERASGAEFFDVSVQYKVDGEFLKYADLSSGQKTLCDIYFISKIITRGGIFVADEFFRFLDTENHDIASSMVKTIDVNQIIISTQNDNFMLDGSDKLVFRLENGISIATY